MAAPVSAARPSRRFVVGAVLVLAASLAIVVVLSLGGLDTSSDPDPPDIWQKEGAPGDLRMLPDGDPISGWWYAGYDDYNSGPGVKQSPMIRLGIEGRQRPSAFRDFVDNRPRGDPMKWHRVRGDRNLYRTGEPRDTPSGRWWRFSTRGSKGARPPGTLPK